MAGFFDKVVAGFDKGVTSVSEGSKNFVEKAKINTQMQETQKNKMNMFRSLGELVYNLHMSGVIQVEQCQGMCNEITSLNAKIEECQRQIADLEAKKLASSVRTVEGGVTCPNCGSVNNAGAKFCAGCGTPVENAVESVTE